MKNNIVLTKEEKMYAKISQSIIATSVCLAFNEEISYTPIFSKELKRKGNLFIQELKKREKQEFNKILDASETETDALYNVQYDFINTIVKLNIFQLDEVKQVIEAYLKEPKAIQGIINQINKRN